MLAPLANMNVRIGADIAEFKAMASKMEKALAPVRARLKSLGTTLSISVTAPLTALAVKGVQAWDKQAKAIAKVENAVRSTGGAAGHSLEQLQQMASDLQKRTLFGDEAILEGATAQLLTFTNIAGEQFSRTQAVALDLATMLGGDLKSASIQLGKALNAPVQNLSALSRSGIQFSAAQKALINTLTRTGRLAEAQNIILSELERQYGGTAEAAALAGTGPLTQLGNAIGDLTEEIGKIVFEAIRPLIDGLRSATEWFASLSDGTKSIIVALGAIAASIGPLLLGLGGILKIIPLLKAGLGVLTGTLGPVAIGVGALAAAGVLLYKNWDRVQAQLGGPLASALERLKSAFATIKTVAIDVFAVAADRLQGVFATIKTMAIDVFGSVVQLARAFALRLLSLWDGIVTAARALWARWGDVIVSITKRVLGQIIDTVTTAVMLFGDIFGALVDLVTGDWSGLWTRMESITQTLSNFIARSVLRMVDVVLAGIDKLFSWIPGVESAVGKARGYIAGLIEEFSAPIVAGPIIGPEKPDTDPLIVESIHQSGRPPLPIIDIESIERAERVQKILSELPITIKAAAAEARLFSDPLGAASAEADAIRGTISSLIEEGLDPAGTLISGLADRFGEVQDTAARMSNAIEISEIMRGAGEQIALARAEAESLGEQMALPRREAEILEATIRQLVAAGSAGFNDTSQAVSAYRDELDRATAAAKAMEQSLRISEAGEEYAASMTLAAAKMQLFGDRSEYARSHVDALHKQIHALLREGVDPLSEQMQGLFENLQVAEKIAETEDAMRSFGERMQGLAQDTLESIGTAFGAALAGTQTLGKGLQQAVGGAFASVLSSLGSLAIRVGLISIGTGKAIAGIQKALASLNPVAAVAAGVALVALGAAVKGALANAARGGGGGGGGSIGRVSGNSSGFGEQSIIENANRDSNPVRPRPVRNGVQDAPPVRIIMESRVTAAGDIAYSVTQGSRRLGRQGTDES